MDSLLLSKRKCLHTPTHTTAPTRSPAHAWKHSEAQMHCIVLQKYVARFEGGGVVCVKAILWTACYCQKCANFSLDFINFKWINNIRVRLESSVGDDEMTMLKCD